MLQDLGEPQRAVEDLNRAIQLYPKYLVAFNNRGLVYSDLGDYEQAVRDHGAAIRLDPTLPRAYALRAIAYTMLGRDNEASSDLDQAVGLGFDGEALLERIQTLQNER
jgi:tetratricopeptide (TPR) repeat protein